MEQARDTERRITDLEIKAAFSEDLLDQLNEIIVRQQQQIDLLVREVGHLRQASTEGGLGAPRNLREELPPHY
jgi:SlyX protein